VPTLTVTVEVPWPRRLTLSALERAIFTAVMAAGRDLLVQALEAWEAQILPGAGVRQRRVRRYLLTRLGPVTFHRWKTLRRGRYGFPLDAAMRLRPRQSCSWWVWQRACRLAKDHPYRQAARLLGELLGTGVDHRVLWGLVQRAGAMRRGAIEAARSELFDDGVAPPEADPVEMVVVELDGAVLRAQGGGVFEAKVTAAYTGKAIASATARHRKRLCTGKVVMAGIYPEGTAGQAIYAWLCRSVHIHRARHTLVSGDGAAWIPAMAAAWFPDAAYQLDHYHLKAKLRATAGGDPHLAGRWISWALAGDRRAIARSMASLVGRGRLHPEAAREALAFLEVNRGAIWASRRLLAAGAPPELCTRGSGVIEHTIDLTVARRMKRQGMRWSREGAHNLLVLRALGMDERAWDRWWEEVSA
jgi:hypothetical protein